MVEGGAKLVRIDLETNRVSRVYTLGKDLAPPGDSSMSPIPASASSS